MELEQFPALNRVSAEDEVCFADLVEWLRDGLETVDQAVLCLRLDGYRLSDIAIELGRSRSSVKHTMVRIRHAYLQRLGDAPVSPCRH